MNSLKPSRELITCGFDWVDRAIAEIGVLEVSGRGDNPRILEYGKEVTRSYNHDSIPWCAYFICWCLELEGIPSTRSGRARSFLNYGKVLEHPVPGCIVIFWRSSIDSSKGHVALFDRIEGDYVYCLGGNQSDQVCIAKYKLSRVLGYRMPLEL